MNQELTITLLDKTITVACPTGQAPALLASTELLNEHMRKVKAKKPTASLLNVALIAALNITNELLEHQEKHLIDEKSISQLSDLITQAL